MTIDAATVAQAIAQLGTTGLLAVCLWTVWQRSIKREARTDAVVDESLASKERVIAMLTRAAVTTAEDHPKLLDARGGPHAS